jgi:hypothetical protein
MIRRYLVAATLAALTLPATALAGPQLGVVIQWGSRPNTNIGYNEGYVRGVRAGEQDGRRGDRFEFYDEGDYRNADHGYRREFGNREYYRVEYRRGFEAGYTNGYRSARPGGRYDAPGPGGRYGYPGYPGGRSGGARGRFDVAGQQGYNDGYEAGFDDGRDGRRFDPIGESRYRSGDRGYRTTFGSRELYKANYRDAFRDGYEEGFREATTYRRY